MARALDIKRQARPKEPKGKKTNYLQSVKHITIGDEVRIITGVDKGVTGRVLTIEKYRGGLRATVENSKEVKRHLKAPEGITPMPRTIDLTNLQRLVKLENPRTRKPKNVGGRPPTTKELLLLYGDIGRVKEKQKEARAEA